MLRQISHDERAQAFCVNFILQATNGQGLGTRLYKAIQTLGKRHSWKTSQTNIVIKWTIK